MAETVISRHISQATKIPFNNPRRRAIGGGCINTAYELDDGKRRFFVKSNRSSLLPMFEAEYAGLQEIAKTRTIKAPQPVCCGEDDAQAFLVMEYIAIGSAPSRDSVIALGENLAAMHKILRPDYGWYRDNTIGSTPQDNRVSSDWIEFWRDRRLGFQLNLAARNGYRGTLQKKGELLLGKIAALFTQQPPPSLLHGDLWSGNYAFDAAGEPVVYDPAVYYGDRETDIAMTELFGGFPADFYAAYQDVYPLDDGYRVRKTLYNLYHILNHLNLFGGGYGGQAERMIENLLSEVS
jgi:protein-ribulosamine 3-kinase